MMMVATGFSPVWASMTSRDMDGTGWLFGNVP
jgi:hypothetical protein